MTTVADLDRLLAALAAIGRPLEIALVVIAVVAALCALVPALARYRRVALGTLVGLLGGGELVLVWFHWRLYALAKVVDPLTGMTTGRVAVPLWVESEKLFVWTLLLGAMALLARRHAEELRAPLLLATALLAVGAVLWGHPFTEPLPDFIAQYTGYLGAMGYGDASIAYRAFQGMEGSRQFYYNTWYMWVHPPLLFASYGAFVVSFAATVLMIARRRSSYEQTAYRWARLGYLPLTAGMLLGFPWAVLAWSGSSWWWSGKVNMSIMMWLLYTAYLHARLYLRRKGQWKLVAALAVLSFVALALTYVTTYVVPGAHSVA